MASVAVTLYDVEEGLQAFLDTADVVPADQEQQFLADFEQALTAAADKRDRTANFLSFLEAQQEYISKEVKRLQALKSHYAAVQERVEGYVSYVIQRSGKDAKGKFRKLEGHTTVMSLRKSPDQVEITDEALIPLDLKRATVTLPASVWNDVLNTIDDDLRYVVLAHTKDTLKVDVEKRAVKSALDAAVEIAGAKLVTDRYSLQRS